jgi:hypothetical protein
MTMNQMTNGDPICPRCGASENLTHHPACHARDGTPLSSPMDRLAAYVENGTLYRHLVTAAANAETELLADVREGTNQAERRQIAMARAVALEFALAWVADNRVAAAELTSLGL